MEQTELIAALIPLISAIIGLLLKELRSRDTNQHGDSFIIMLKEGAETLEKFAVIFPQLQVYSAEMKEIVAEAEQIWNSSSFTAQDAKFIQYKYELLQKQIAKDLENIRKLKKE